MNLAAIIIGVAIAVAVAAYVAEPLIRGQRDRKHQTSNINYQGADLELEYRATLEAIRELDFDFQTGKIVEEDYQLLRERYVLQGAALLQKLDQLGARRASETISDQIEALVLARRKAGSQARPAQACPACGQPCRAGDRFCGKCGARLEGRA
jgi:hypothetical protein